MTFTGWTDGFESDNANKAGYTPELQEYDLQKYVLNLGVMQQGIYFNYDWGKGTGLRQWDKLIVGSREEYDRMQANRRNVTDYSNEESAE
jgi:hypothetical protein